MLLHVTQVVTLSCMLVAEHHPSVYSCLKVGNIKFEGNKKSKISVDLYLNFRIFQTKNLKLLTLLLAEEQVTVSNNTDLGMNSVK